MEHALKTVFPEHIRKIAVTAPAGRPDAGQLTDIRQKLQSAGIEVADYMPQATLHTPHYLAGDIEERIRKFNAAVNDPSADLIICARGGFGCVHLLDRIDYATLRERQLPVMGYSDITALHCAMLAKNAGVAIAGSNFVSLDQIVKDDFTAASHRLALTLHPGDTTLPEAPQKLYAIHANSSTNKVSGRMYAANLTVLASLCGSNYLPDFRDMILVLEDVNEPVYKLDRMLEQLLLCGVFKQLKALVFGGFSGVDDPTELAALQQRIAGQINIPCFCGFQFGHTFPMCAVNSRHIFTLDPACNITVCS